MGAMGAVPEIVTLGNSLLNGHIHAVDIPGRLPQADALHYSNCGGELVGEGHSIGLEHQYIPEAAIERKEQGAQHVQPVLDGVCTDCSASLDRSQNHIR